MRLPRLQGLTGAAAEIAADSTYHSTILPPLHHWYDKRVIILLIMACHAKSRKKKKHTLFSPEVLFIKQ